MTVKTTKQPRKKKETVIPEEILPAPIEEASPLTKDLVEADKEAFAAMLRQKMSLEDRANQLVELAGYTDSKRAPVALRAIEEINKITGIKEDKPSDVAPMFVLPPNTAVAIKVFEPDE